MSVTAYRNSSPAEPIRDPEKCRELGVDLSTTGKPTVKQYQAIGVHAEDVLFCLTTRDEIADAGSSRIRISDSTSARAVSAFFCKFFEDFRVGYQVESSVLVVIPSILSSRIVLRICISSCYYSRFRRRDHRVGRDIPEDSSISPNTAMVAHFHISDYCGASTYEAVVTNAWSTKTL